MVGWINFEFVGFIALTTVAIGELANFGAYAFVSAILVTPLGAVSVVVRFV